MITARAYRNTKMQLLQWFTMLQEYSSQVPELDSFWIRSHDLHCNWFNAETEDQREELLAELLTLSSEVRNTALTLDIELKANHWN